MAKSPKSDKNSDDPQVEDGKVAEDAVEDAVVIEENAADEDTAENSPETDEAVGEAEPVDSDSDVSDAADDAEPVDETAEDVDPDDTGDTVDGSQQTPETLPVVTEGQTRSGGAGFLGFVLGGVIAGVIGFGAAQYVNGGWPFGATDAEDPLASAMETQTADIAALREQVESNGETLSTLVSDTSLEELGGQLRADIVATQSRIEEMSGRLSDLDERITALEKMPQGDSAEAAEAAAAAYERELAGMREMLDREIAALQAQQEDAETLQQNAAEAAQASSARAAMSRIMAALDSGQPFDDALFDLSTATGTDAPTGLASVASDGVPTLAELRDSFPDAAREALDDSLRAMVEAGEIGRGEAFLRTQLGSRSLEPQEGDDPDAILSRAEFELKNGRIGAALDELSAMPEAAQPALSDWIQMARTRQAALAAGSELSQTLNQ
ncbi:MAG TPA: hypothetical protein DEO85_00495 [Maritimibacter sp.]|nr:hypothetical protein [Maritimibacter sp.]